MNFNFTKKKTIGSIILGLLATGVYFFEEIFAGEMDFVSLIISWVILSGIVFSVWGFFQKSKNKKNREPRESPVEGQEKGNKEGVPQNKEEPENPPQKQKEDKKPQPKKERNEIKENKESEKKIEESEEVKE